MCAESDLWTLMWLLQVCCTMGRFSYSATALATLFAFWGSDAYRPSPLLASRGARSTRVRMSASTEGAKPMTLTEKILAKAAGKAYVQPNDNIWVNVDGLMTHDVCGPGTFGIFKKEFGPTAKVRQTPREKHAELKVSRRANP